MSAEPFQLFRPLDSATEGALRESILRFGVLVPVARDQHGRTLDGYHRSRIADELGVSYRVDVVTVTDDEEAREIARTLNADRRHLTREQQREIARFLRGQGHSLRAIAKATDMDKQTVARDVTGVSPETPADLVAGLDGKRYPSRRPTVVAAKNAREAERAQTALAGIDDLPAGRVIDVKRAERIARQQQAERRRTEQPREFSRGEITLRPGDFAEALNDITDAAAIITDPPYGRESLPLIERLGRFAAQALARDGVLVAMAGQLHLHAWQTLLRQHLSERWIGCYLAPGPRETQVHSARVRTGWKPLLIYTRQDCEIATAPWLFDDVFRSPADAKTHHEWEQSLPGMIEIVERFTESGQLVIDPFLGSGTTAVACARTGRRFVGADVDAAALAAARERLEEAGE